MTLSTATYEQEGGVKLSDAAKKWPELPAKPTKWTRKMVMHLNFGSDGGAATFTIHDPDGAQMPFGYQYDTRKDGLTGFTIPADKEIALTWSELCKRWPNIETPHPKDSLT